MTLLSVAAVCMCEMHKLVLFTFPGQLLPEHRHDSTVCCSWHCHISHYCWRWRLSLGAGEFSQGNCGLLVEALES